MLPERDLLAEAHRLFLYVIQGLFILASDAMLKYMVAYFRSCKLPREKSYLSQVHSKYILFVLEPRMSERTRDTISIETNISCSFQDFRLTD